MWLVERPDLDERPDTMDPGRGVAFEDDRGRWWVWEPATRRFHNDTPWLFTHFYYRAGARRTELVEVEIAGQLRFTPFSADESRRLIENDQVGGAGEKHVTERRQREPTLELEEALRQMRSSGG